MPTRVFIREPGDENISALSPPSSPELSGSIFTSNQSTSFRRSRRRRPPSLSTKDISASSRLSGYLFIFTAYVVLFVSSIKFEEKENEANDDNLLEINEWKRLCSIVGSASFAGLMVFIVGMHFDLIIAPNLWLAIFKDGSYGEALLLTILVFAAIFMVYVSTSVDGIGGFVGANYNVYFSSWIGFFACLYTFDLWKKSALENNQQNQALLRAFHNTTSNPQRKTSYVWSWTLLFSFVTFLSLLDILTIGDSDWVGKPVAGNQLVIMLLFTSMSALCCLIGLLMNILCSRYPDFKILRHWYKIEGVLIIVLVGFWSWAVFKYTGINGLVNGPSNSYFGAWGGCFCSISIIGAWSTEYWN